MDSLYDVQQLLKQFGIYVYTKDRLGDLDLMALELRDLYDSGLLEEAPYAAARLQVARERARLHAAGYR